MCGSGMLRGLVKFGKRLSFPSAPSSLVCRMAASVESSQDPRPKSTILFPFSNDNDNDNANDESYTPPPRPSYFRHHRLKDIDEAMPDLLASQIPEYPDSVNAMVAPSNFSKSIQVGHPFDVISLLSNSCGSASQTHLFRPADGETVRVEDLVGKNIVVCCVYIPLYWLSLEASSFRNLSFACSKAFSADFQVVVVPKMRPSWANDEDAFDHFLSGLPSSWLAIPFSHTLRRDFVCKSLQLISSDPICLLVAQDNEVLLHQCIVSCVSKLTSEYGIPWWRTHSQLHAVFGCKPSDCLYQINDAASISVSELDEKLVGVYLCKDGSFIRTLSVVHRECKSKGLDFEIVLVYLPVRNDHISNPRLFQDAINHVLHKLHVNSWWVLPYNDFRYHRFMNHRQSFDVDELIIVGPHNEFVEPLGKDVISSFGLDAYPFTKEHFVEKEYQKISALTLESLLGNVFLYHHCRNKVLTPDELREKIVLLYIDHALPMVNFRLFHFPLVYWYLHNKETRESPDDFEVVFAALDDDLDAACYFPWFSCTLDPQNTDLIKDRLLKGRNCALVAFGKDGKILSYQAQSLLESHDPDGIQSYQGLRNEIVDSNEHRYLYSVYAQLDV